MCCAKAAGIPTACPWRLDVEKQLGLTGKEQIEEYGVAEFNERCKASVWNYLEDWTAMTERMAFWVDIDNAYVTMKTDYIESLWWILKQFWDKKLLYQGYKVVPYCPRCGTPLSSHELSLGYKEGTVDPSVYVKFAVEGRRKQLFAGVDDDAVDAAGQCGAGRGREDRLCQSAR